MIGLAVRLTFFLQIAVFLIFKLLLGFLIFEISGALVFNWFHQNQIEQYIFYNVLQCMTWSNFENIGYWKNLLSCRLVISHFWNLERISIQEFLLIPEIGIWFILSTFLAFGNLIKQQEFVLTPKIGCIICVNTFLVYPMEEQFPLEKCEFRKHSKPLGSI